VVGSALVKPVHPFRSLWESGDLGAWIDALEPDVVVHSPMLTTTFLGRETAAELYGVLVETLGDVEIAEELWAGSSYACLWRAEVGGRRIEGADFIRSNAQGKIAEIRVLIRPLAGIGAFASGVGPPFAATRGRPRATVMRLLNLPLRVIFALADVVGPRLVLRRQARGRPR
jgi:hypothetical protein